MSVAMTVACYLESTINSIICNGITRLPTLASSSNLARGPYHHVPSVFKSRNPSIQQDGPALGVKSMTETEKMERHITSIKRPGEVLHTSIGSAYHAISLQLRGEFAKWMRSQERLTGIPDDLAWACLREYNRYLLRDVRD